MLDLDSIADDLSEVIADLPVSCAYKGTAFAATSTDAGTSRMVEIEGELHTVDRSIVTAAVAVLSGAKGDDAITVDGTAYRIMSISRHQDGVGVEVNLKVSTR